MSASSENPPIPPQDPSFAGPGFNSSSYYGYPPQPKKTSKALIVVIILLILAVLFLPVACMFAGSTSSFSLNDKIAVVHIDGEIGSSGGASSPEGLLMVLDEAESDPTIAAVVLRVDSGGGYSASGEEMAQYVKDFSKPIVVSSGNANASAAYLISSQSDYLYTNASSSIGSIGAAIRLMDYSDLLKMLGIDAIDITSSEGKDSSYGTRPLTEEEIAEYQDQVNQINQYFISAVAEGRNMTTEDVSKYANGMTMTGQDAVDAGLCDEVGTFEDACNKAASLAGVSSYDVVSLDETGSDLLSLLYSSTSSEQLSAILKATENESATVTAQ